MTANATCVVGVDTSAESLAALHWALRLARGLGMRLVAVHAVGLLEEGGYRPRPDLARIVDEAREGPSWAASR